MLSDECEQGWVTLRDLKQRVIQHTVGVRGSEVDTKDATQKLQQGTINHLGRSRLPGSFQYSPCRGLLQRLINGSSKS